MIIRGVAYLGSRNSLSYNFELGKENQIIIPKKFATGSSVRIIDPKGNEFLRQSVILPSGTIVDFSDMDLPGVYQILNSNEVVVCLIALNLQHSESDLTKVVPKDILNKIERTINTKSSKNTKIDFISDKDDIIQQIARIRSGTELWRLFILLALLLSVAEMVVRRSAVAEQPQ